MKGIAYRFAFLRLYGPLSALVLGVDVVDHTIKFAFCANLFLLSKAGCLRLFFG